MAFTGKATYSAGAVLPEAVEDVSDLIGIVSPYETPLLDALGDSLRAATSTHHEWLEDELLPNKDTIKAIGASCVSVADGKRFRVGDQIQADKSEELMLVTAITENVLTVVRGYAGTTQSTDNTATEIRILGNAAIEGGDKPQARFTNRQRRGNHTQIFTQKVEVSDPIDSKLSASDEMDYQKQERLRELIRDLENAVINGGMGVKNKTVQRIMHGILHRIETNAFGCGDDGFPAGRDLDEEKINHVLRKIWEASSGNVDLIVVGGFQKRKMNAFTETPTGTGAVHREPCNLYESDYGVCRVVVCRWMPQEAVLLLDSSRINVLPLAGRSFHFKPLASSGDYECGELIGEYTVEMKNEAAHSLITRLSTE